MRRTRGFLLLYTMAISLMTTLTIIGVVMRPETGWWPVIEQQYERFFAEKKYKHEPLVAPTPNEPTYRIGAFYDEGRQVIQGRATVTIPRLRLDKIPFYLYQSMQVKDVLLNGQPVKFDLTAKQLTLHATEAEGEQTVSFSFETKIPQTATRVGSWKGISTLAYWYPILAVERDGHWEPRPDPLGFGDPYLMDLGNYVVEWNTPADIRWFTSAPWVQQSPAEGGRVIHTYQAEKLRNFALVGGRTFQESRFETGTGTTVLVGALSLDSLNRTLELARSAVKTFNETIGTNPYRVLNVLELPEGTVYAHELPNMALFSRDLWDYPGRDPEHWIVHEIGHVWFYNSVGNYEAETPWLDEGLADYLALIEMQKRRGDIPYYEHIKDSWNRFRQGYTYTPYRPGTAVGITDGQSAVPYGSYPSSHAHYYYSYLRPILMYHDLRKELGDERFFKFLRQYYVKNVQRTATRADLEQALSDIEPAALPRMKMWLDLPNDELIQQVKGRFR